MACTAPAAAMAALTPQIDTAEASRARSLSSSPSRPPSHQVNPNTTLIRTSACTMAGPAALTITAMLIDAPSSTSPVLMKNSVRKPPASRSRSPSRVSATLPSRPSTMAYTGYSMAAATLPRAVPFVAAGTVCSSSRVRPPRTSTTATPARAQRTPVRASTSGSARSMSVRSVSLI